MLQWGNIFAVWRNISEIIGQVSWKLNTIQRIKVEPFLGGRTAEPGVASPSKAHCRDPVSALALLNRRSENQALLPPALDKRPNPRGINLDRDSAFLFWLRKLLLEKEKILY